MSYDDFLARKQAEADAWEELCDAIFPQPVDDAVETPLFDALVGERNFDPLP